MNLNGGERINTVHVDGLVVLKIIQHCTESLTTFVTGSLVGLDTDGVLEVTNSFYSGYDDDEEDYDETAERQAFQIDMLEAMREVNFDNNNIGWYRSCSLGSFCSLRLVQDQFAYQKDLSPNSVVLIFDPVRTTNGSLTLKAFRLQEEFMKKVSAESLAKLTQSQLDGMDRSSILEEIPVKIQNSHLAQAFLYELKSSGSFSYDAERLALTKDSVLENHLENLIDTMDVYSEEIRNLHSHDRNTERQRQAQDAWIQKRKAENISRKENGLSALPLSDKSLPLFKSYSKPSRLPSLLVAHQIDLFCDQVKTHAGEGLHKLHLAGEFQK